MVKISLPGEAGSWPDIALIGSHLYGGAVLRANESLLLYRLDSTTGALDTGFGMKIIPFPVEPEQPREKDLQSNELHARAPQVPDNKFRQRVNSGLAQFDANGDLDRSFNEVGMRRFFIRNGRLHFTLCLAVRYKNGQHEGFYYGGSYRLGGDDVQAWVGAIDKEGKVVTDFADNGMWIVYRLPGEPNTPHLSVRAIFQTQDHLYCGGTVGEDAFVIRMNLDGQIDSTFNNGNAVRLKIDRFERTRTFDLAADGEGVLVGLEQSSGANVARVVVRLNAAGQIDQQFAQEGYLTAPEDWGVDQVLVRNKDDGRFLEIRAPGYIARYPL
ncbi:hypothetical protein D3C77_433920 [compost metagenome]